MVFFAGFILGRDIASFFFAEVFGEGEVIGGVVVLEGVVFEGVVFEGVVFGGVGLLACAVLAGDKVGSIGATGEGSLDGASESDDSSEESSEESSEDFLRLFGTLEASATPVLEAFLFFVFVLAGLGDLFRFLFRSIFPLNSAILIESLAWRSEPPRMTTFLNRSPS